MVRITMGVLASVLLASTAMAQDKIAVGSAQSEFPESITSTSDGTLYVSSVGQGVVFKVAPGGASEVFLEAPAEGPKTSLGVLADEKNGTLWVCYADFGAFSGQGTMASVLRSYALADGALKETYTFPAVASFCNDIATTDDGTAYVADTVGSKVYTAKGGELVEWKADAVLAGVDGLGFGPDGDLYVNSVTTNKLFRIDVAEDGSAGAITELTVSEELKGPDGMRFGEDGVLYVAENGAARVSAITIEGDTATVRPLPGEAYDMATAVTKVGDTLYVIESKFSKLGGTENPGQFYVYPVPLSGAM